MFTDTHAHLYSKEFDSDRDDMIKRAIDQGVTTFLLPNIDADSLPSMIKLCQQYPGQCYPMVGLHPCSVQQDWSGQLKFLGPWIEKSNAIAIGEIGIDLYWDSSTLPEQKKAFHHQINWGIENDLPIVIHSRNSIDIILDILDEYENTNLSGVFHCFSGNYNHVERILGLGFYFGLGGVVTFKKNQGLRDLIAEIPISSLLLETDAPYLSPHPHRGKRNESSYLFHTAEVVAQIKNISLQELGRQTEANVRELFKNLS